MDADAKCEYIKALIEHLESQKKYNLLFVTFNIGIIAVILNKSVFNEHPLFLSYIQNILLSASLALMSISASLFMIWHILLHNLRIKAIDLYITLDIDAARKLHYPGNEFYNRWGWISRWAGITIVAGIIGCISLIYSRIL